MQPPVTTGPALRARLPLAGDRLRLGAQLEVSPLCIGGVQEAATIPEAFEAGINFFFVTADMHWPLYEQTRRGLERLFEMGVRQRVVVAGVSYTTQPEFCHLPFGELIQAVRGLGRLDVTVIGGSYAADFVRRRIEYEKHRDDGVLATGCTFHDREAAAFAVSTHLLDIAFVRYNSAHPGAEDDLFPHLPREKPALLYNFKSAMGHVDPARFEGLGIGPGKWRPRLVDHYRFVLSRPELDGILCAPGTPAELRSLLEALGDGPLDTEQAEYMKKVSLCARGELEVSEREDRHESHPS